MENKPWNWFKSTKRRIRTCILLYSPWAVRFKASRNKHFLEALSLYSRSPSKCSFFLKEIADQNQILPSSFLPHPILPYNSTYLLLHLQDSSSLSINHEKSHAVILCFSHSWLTLQWDFWGAFCWLELIRKNIYIRVLASWAYINVVNYIMKPVWVGILKLLSS